jgi:hypothetical protein
MDFDWDLESLPGAQKRHSLDALELLLTLAAGVKVGVGNAMGLNNSGELVAVSLGFGGLQSSRPVNNWYCSELSEDLLSLIPKTLDFSSQNPDYLTHLRVSIALYRSANEVREFTHPELGILVGCTALEVITDEILESEAGWDQTLLTGGRSVPLWKRIKAATRFVGLSQDIFDHAEGQYLTAAKAKLKVNDDFEFLIKVRNDIAHAGVSEVSGMDLLRVFETYMWLCELFLLRKIGYSGPYCDRRVIRRNRNKTEPWPLTR